MQERQFIEHVGKPLTLFLPIQIQAPKRVVQRFFSHHNFVHQGLLGEMLKGSAELKVVRKVIFPIQTKHGFALHAIIIVAFKRHIHRRSGIQNALV